MRITSGLFFNTNIPKLRSKPVVCSKPVVSVKEIRNISFNGLPTLIADKIANKFNNPLKNFKEFSVDEYKTLNPKQIKTLRKRFEHLSKTDMGYFYKNSEIVHDKVSDVIKTNLDKTYGKGNYKVITIGRSLSSIGKVLGYKIGEKNVINVSLSNARDYRADSGRRVDDVVRSVILQKLAKKGLSKDAVMKSDKKYVIMDYCMSGDSLKGATDLFKSLYDNSPNITSLNPDTVIENQTLKTAYRSCMLASVYKKFSFSERTMFVSDISSRYKNVKKADYETKLMWFKLLDNTVNKKKFDLKDIRTDNPSLLQLEF